ncbi:MAG: hypothetical protein ACREKQ_14660 [Candidatus Rokuibacteriota bacterium]
MAKTRGTGRLHILGEFRRADIPTTLFIGANKTFVVEEKVII